MPTVAPMTLNLLKLAARIALTNGLLVLVAAVALGLLPPAVRPWTPVSILPAAAVLGLIAAWRSWVHARAWVDEQGPAWRGVFEAVCLGPLITGIALTPHLVSRLWEAPGDFVPAVAFAAKISAPMILIGLVAGLVLRAVALFQLRRAASHA